MVDLHVHTTHSDGTLTPRQVVEAAARLGLRALAVTDHDSVDGNPEALAAGRELGVPVLPGVELSVRWQGITFHLLGYGVARLSPDVVRTFRRLIESRNARNPRMVERLRALGIEITLEEVEAVAPGHVVGRPHFAQVLVRKGVVRSVQEAFDRLIGRGQPAYVDKERLPPAEACRLIRKAGGLPVLAHPGLLEEKHPAFVPRLVEHLLDHGLAGIEAYYSRHTPDQVARYRALARTHGLLVTGGSDFHQPDGEGPRLGTGFGSLNVPDACYEALVQRLAAHGSRATGCPPGGTSPAG